ncbi:MAG: carboxypeptidase-like regulatory domain-containing protein [Planctomycetaceae bacterium]|nr:carboxypeptidase-like regulatory domain-containing protein [Planctomycetaceae bacterium]
MIFKYRSGHAKLIALIALIVVATLAIIAVVILVPAGKMSAGKMSDEQKIARISVPNNAIREVTVRGKLLMPDGTPTGKGRITSTSVLYTSERFLWFSYSNGNSTREGCMTMTNLKDDTGTFEFRLDEGSNAILTARYDTDGGSSSGMTLLSGNPGRLENQKLIARPVAFVPKENGPEIVLQYEEGVLVEGTVTFDDGKPAVNRSLLVRQYVTPALGADIPAVQEKMTVGTTTKIGEDGKFALYLLPGEYTFVTSSFPLQEEYTQKVVVERGKENRLKLAAPSPIHVRFELEDGTPPNGLNVMHVGAYYYLGRRDSFNTFLYQAFDREDNEHFDRVKFQPGDAITVYPTELNNYLIVTTYDNEYGLVEKITPQMRGKEITLVLRPTIKVTEDRPPSQKFTREWEFQYADAKSYSVRQGAQGDNHIFKSDEHGRLTYAVPVYAGDYKDLFFFLSAGQNTDSGGEGGSGKYKRKPSDPPLFSVDPKTQKIIPHPEQ